MLFENFKLVKDMANGLFLPVHGNRTLDMCNTSSLSVTFVFVFAYVCICVFVLVYLCKRLEILVWHEALLIIYRGKHGGPPVFQNKAQSYLDVTTMAIITMIITMTMTMIIMIITMIIMITLMLFTIVFSQGEAARPRSHLPQSDRSDPGHQGLKFKFLGLKF